MYENLSFLLACRWGWRGPRKFHWYPVGMDTDVVRVLWGWMKMLWDSCGDVKEMWNSRCILHYGASSGKNESVNSFLWIAFPLQCKIIHCHRYSGTISYTHSLNVDCGHLYQQWWEKFCGDRTNLCKDELYGDGWGWGQIYVPMPSATRQGKSEHDQQEIKLDACIYS